MHSSGPLRALQRAARMRAAFPTTASQQLLRSRVASGLPASRSSLRRTVQPAIATYVRWNSTESRTGERPLTDRDEQSDAEAIAARKAANPAYQLWVTCKKCLERSSHIISKQAYHFGSCVIQCPKCKNQHLISDNLKIFSDTNITMEDIAKEHGEKLRKGRLGTDGDIEFYDEDATEKVLAK